MSNQNAPVPPQNLDAEESVLGTMLLSSGAINAVSEVVTASDFYRPSHGLIFQAAVEMDARGEPVDAITLVDELDKRGQLSQVGGKLRIHEIAALVPAASNAAHYARIVRETARRRDLIRAGDEIRKLGWEGVGDVDDLLMQAERHVTEATTTSNTGDFSSLGDALVQLTEDVTTAVQTGKPIAGLRTGFPDLDKLTTGFYPGQVVIIAARPGVGKSLLSQNICENVAERGVPAAMFTLEMSDRELALRSIVRKTRLDLNSLRTGKLTTAELGKVQEVLPLLRQRPFYVEDNPAVNVSELRARARRLKAKHGLGLLVVDYLQLLLSDQSGKSDNRNNEVAAISRSLKLLAKELRIPIIVISQLNRNTEYRADKRPTLADLRDSGAVEQDADLVMFIYREETYKKVDPERGGETELIIAKNRMGAQDTINLLFLGRRQTFATPAFHDQAGG